MTDRQWWQSLDPTLVEVIGTTTAGTLAKAWDSAFFMHHEEIGITHVLETICLRTGAAGHDVGAVLGDRRVRCGYDAGKRIGDARASDARPTPRFSDSLVGWLEAARARFEGKTIRTAMLLERLASAPERLAAPIAAIASIDPAALGRAIDDGTLASGEDLTPFRPPEPLQVAADEAPLAPPDYSYVRLEISGGHTGSSFRWHSILLPTHEHVQAELRAEVGDPQGLLFLAFEQPAIVLEAYDGDRRTLRASLWPHLAIAIDGEPLALDDKGALAFDYDSDEGQDLEGRALSSGHVELTLRAHELGVPPPSRPPLPPGLAARFELDGTPKVHAPGWIGAWDFAPRSLPDVP